MAEGKEPRSSKRMTDLIGQVLQINKLIDFIKGDVVSMRVCWPRICDWKIEYGILCLCSLDAACFILFSEHLHNQDSHLPVGP